MGRLRRPFALAVVKWPSAASEDATDGRSHPCLGTLGHCVAVVGVWLPRCRSLEGARSLERFDLGPLLVSGLQILLHSATNRIGSVLRVELVRLVADALP